ncbi:MAG: HNH endonuclease, partial [Mycolicibacterium sp.]|nr:HNH endonuclease [Mycolicibacterium sp.]
EPVAPSDPDAEPVAPSDAEAEPVAPSDPDAEAVEVDSASESPAPSAAQDAAAEGCRDAEQSEADADSESPAPPAVQDTAADHAPRLDGVLPSAFTKPLREQTLTEALTGLTERAPAVPSTIRPAAMMGGQFLPGEIAQRAALGATITAIVHPGQAPPEQRYTPSKKLADFIRARDMTCRFPGCCAPATNCDLDHTIPWPYGPTQASNLKALCRKHHLLKTFWGGQGGWQDRQFPDGTVEWRAPDGRRHLTRPGSRRLFPELCTPTAPTEVTGRVPTAHNPGLRMPRRKTTRAQDRAHRIAEERELNRADAEGDEPRSYSGVPSAS